MILYSLYKSNEDDNENVECFYVLVLHGLECGWKPMKSTGFEDFASEVQGKWIESLFKNLTEEDKFNSNFEIIQFHPNTSYEFFIRGIRPQTKGKSLMFSVGQGMLDKIDNVNEDFLLIIHEINRADLSKVLGEAIFLLEPLEIDEKSNDL